MTEDDCIGSVIDGRYLVGEEIGEGAMGVVYRCRHVRLDKDVAIKILRRERGHSSDTIRRFVKEAKIASSLSHPNIVDLSDCGELPEGGAYIVMELLEGEALADRLARERCVAPKTAFSIALQIVAGLKAAHDCEIVHRDLKPENVFLCTGPDGGLRVKLLDFGIARAKNSKDTLPGAVMGTPEYMAPEQARGAVVDTRADLYALGVMIFEMLAGRVPLYAENVAELLRLKHTTEPMRLRDAAADLGRFARTEALLAELLDRDLERRIQTIAEADRRLREAFELDFADEPRSPGVKVTQGIGSGAVAEPFAFSAHAAYAWAIAWRRPGTGLPSAERHPDVKGKTEPAPTALESTGVAAIAFPSDPSNEGTPSLPACAVRWDQSEPARPGDERTKLEARGLRRGQGRSWAVPLVLGAALLCGAVVAGAVLRLPPTKSDASPESIVAPAQPSTPAVVPPLVEPPSPAPAAGTEVLNDAAPPPAEAPRQPPPKPVAAAPVPVKRKPPARVTPLRPTPREPAPAKLPTAINEPPAAASSPDGPKHSDGQLDLHDPWGR